jgi:hypothetical protein
MKDMTWGTFTACAFIFFMLGFLACHKIYMGIEERHDINTIRRNNPSLHGSKT